MEEEEEEEEDMNLGSQNLVRSHATHAIGELKKVWIDSIKGYGSTQDIIDGSHCMYQRAGMREVGLPLPPAFYYLILMTSNTCDSNMLIISALESCNFNKLKLCEKKMSLLQF